MGSALSRRTLRRVPGSAPGPATRATTGTFAELDACAVFRSVGNDRAENLAFSASKDRGLGEVDCRPVELSVTRIGFRHDRRQALESVGDGGAWRSPVGHRQSGLERRSGRPSDAAGP